LTPTAPDLGVVYADPPRGEEGEAGEYFGALARQVAAKLQACGLGARQSPSRVSQDITCRTLSGWKEFYAGLIRDPIGNAVYAARAYFDFHVVSGDASLGAELKRMILAELESDQAFIPVLANDTLANLPPLTFYQGSVIETDGTPARTLDVEKTALDPIVDAARVWAFAGREVSGSNTLQRLGFSAGVTPQYASVLNDAAEGWRIVAYHHALAGLSDQDGGTVIQPWRLSRFEERLLKTAFDATRRLLALTSSIYNSTVSP
jgi:CBS domain-containing protein